MRPALLLPLALLACLAACTTARPVAETAAAPQDDGIVPLTLEQERQISE